MELMSSSSSPPSPRPSAASSAQLLLVAARAPQAVDGPVAGRGHDPARRVAGHAVARPALERHHEGVLHGLLGEVEVAENPDEGGDRPPRLAPEQAVDLVGGGSYRATPASLVWVSEPAAS